MAGWWCCWVNLLWEGREEGRVRVVTILTCILLDILSLSPRISCRVLVPRMFLRVVWASSLVEWCESSTLATEMVALDTR